MPSQVYVEIAVAAAVSTSPIHSRSQWIKDNLPLLMRWIRGFAITFTWFTWVDTLVVHCDLITFSPNFSQHGKSLLVQPCISSPIFFTKSGISGDDLYQRQMYIIKMIYYQKVSNKQLILKIHPIFHLHIYLTDKLSQSDNHTTVLLVARLILYRARLKGGG